MSQTSFVNFSVRDFPDLLKSYGRSFESFAADLSYMNVISNIRTTFHCFRARVTKAPSFGFSAMDIYEVIRTLHDCPSQMNENLLIII